MSPRAGRSHPEDEVTYTKGEVNRAGKLLRAIVEEIEANKDDHDVLVEVTHRLVDAIEVISWWRRLHAHPLSKVAVNLRYHVSAEGCDHVDVTQRLKRLPTIIDKLEREPTMQLTQMGDIGGVRARVPSLDHLRAVSRRLQRTWTIVRTRDYIEEPRDSGYRAVHHIVRRDERLIEVQLRTPFQDAWANQVEEDSRRLDVGYKFGQGDADVHDYYRAISEVFAVLDREEDLSPDQVAAINESYSLAAGKLEREPEREDN
ncbi:MAG TPA: RelA/SpoT domain-containing protein [Solirubrobacterales bacterium]|nr:RelA/SpoT domain-containing protein [Solirubrobacterales bacterium]